MSTLLIRNVNLEAGRLNQLSDLTTKTTNFIKENKASIVAVGHSAVAPISLTLLTSNVLYSIAYILFTTYIYIRIQKEETIYRHIVLFANTIWLAITAIFIMLITIGTNAEYLSTVFN